MRLSPMHLAITAPTTMCGWQETRPPASPLLGGLYLPLLVQQLLLDLGHVLIGFDLQTVWEQGPGRGYAVGIGGEEGGSICGGEEGEAG